MGRRFSAVVWCMIGLVMGGALPLRGSSVVISEIMAVNSGPLADENGDFSDWIELHNEGSNTVALLGWYLTDKATALTKWAFPNVSLAPGQFMVIFASEKNRLVAGQPLHTNFKLSGEGEYLALVRPNGTTVEFSFSPTFPEQYSGMSYGVAVDANTTMVPFGAIGKLKVPNVLQAPVDWMDRTGFNDSGWRTEPGGTGYETAPGLYASYLQSTVSVGTVSFYQRFSFNLDGTEQIDRLALSVLFDDGFIAYLNGVRVAESNAPAVPVYSSTATVSRVNAEAVISQAFDLTPYLGLLEQGVNMLAIHGLNAGSSDGDMLLSAALIGSPTNNAVPLRYFTTPTPGTTNQAGYEVVAGAPAFSLPAGFYTNAQTLALSASGAGATVRYTLNGDEPTESSPGYAAPLAIASRAGQSNVFAQIPTAPTAGQGQWSWMPRWAAPAGEVFKANVVRARTFAPGKIPSPIVTQTYFVNTNIFQRYGHLPVISITSDRKNLFDNSTGIMVPGVNYTGSTSSGNYYKRWEKNCHMEWFASNGVAHIDQDVGVRIQGNSSCASPQKGLSIFARGEYGKETVDYPIFETVHGRASTVKSFDRFMLRGWGSFRGRGLLYDPFCHLLLDETDLDLQNYRPCVVFVNGEYWGLHELREANKNSHYLEEFHEVDRDDPGYDVLYGSGPYVDFDPDFLTDYSYVDEGDATNWNALINFLSTQNMTLPANYAYAQTLIDVDAFLLYMIHGCFTVKADWPNQNEAKFRARTPDAKWRWLQFDLDHGFQDSWGTDMLGNVLGHNVFSRLDDNPEFVNRFLNMYADLMNSAFRTDVMLARFDAMAAELMPFAPEFHNRWPVIEGGSTQMNNWNGHLAAMRVNIANRVGFERPNLQSRYGLAGTATITLNVTTQGQGKIRINTIDIDAGTPGVTNGLAYPWQGVYFRGVSMQCTAIPEDGYRFVGWQGLSTSTTNPVTFTMSGNAALTATFAPFDSATFPLRVTEVMAAPAAGAGILATNDAEFIELHNAGGTTLDLRDVSFTEGIAFTFTNTWLLPAGGYAVLVKDATAFAARYPSVSAAGVYAGSLDNSGETLRLKATPWGPTLAAFTYGDSREWPLAAGGAGHSLVPLVPSDPVDGRLDHGAYWQASAFRFGSPGTADPSSVQDVVLNEIMAHTDLDDPTNFPGYDSNDWIELYNLASGAIGFTDWFLSDDAGDLKKWALPAAESIAAHGWRLFDEVTGFHAPLTNGFGLNKAGETLFLSYLPGTSQDRVADALQFKGQDNGISFGRFPDGAAFWSAMSATPESANGVPLAHLIISEIMANPPIVPGGIDQNGGVEFIEIWNCTSNAVTLASEAGAWRLGGGVDFSFDPVTIIPAGGFLAVVAFEPATDTAARQTFQATYGQTNGQSVLVGPFDGQLANEGERVALERPQPPDTLGEGVSWVIVDEVQYAPYAPWPTSASGTGSSIRRMGAASMGMDPTAWISDLFPSPGQPPSILAIATPAAGSEFLLPFTSTVAVVIDESQVVGGVNAVEFLQNGASLGTDTEAPYSWPLSTITAPGEYVLTAVLTDGAGSHASAPAAITAMSVDNEAGATEIAEATARLRGRLVGEGTARATFYWGPVDGGTNPSAWAHAEYAGTVGEGTFDYLVGGLSLGQEYFYRVHVANDFGATWAPTTSPFRKNYDAWPYRMKITLAGLTVSDTLQGFPVLVAFSTNTVGFSYGSFGAPGGSDLRFAESTNCPVLPFEIDAWNPSGISYAWVRMPVIPPGSTSIWAFWGNSEASLPVYATNGNVWAPGTARVLHLQGGTADASSNHVSAINTGSVAAAGIVGEGRYFDGVDDVMDPVLPAAWYGTNSQALALSLWVRPETGNNATVIGAYGGGHDIPLYIAQSSGNWKCVVRTTGSINQEHAVSTGAWQMLTLVLDQGQARIYRDGQPAAVPIAYTPFKPTRDLLIGMLNGQSAAEYRLRGTLDEVRIAAVAYSPAWVRASYLTVASNALVTTYRVGVDDGDADGDGLPDAWEREHFGTEDDPLAQPELDVDLDGAYNGDEFTAGTDPTNRANVFHVDVIWSGNLARISFFGIEADDSLAPQERFYALEGATNLMLPFWQGIPSFTNVRGANGVVTYSNTPSISPPQYYRGRVWLQNGSP